MENLRGILLMIGAMVGFALEDVFIKSMSQTLPVGQILVTLGVGGAAIFSVMAVSQGHRLLTPALWRGPVLLRNLSELVGTFGFVMAVALTPLASASAILQATPLAVTLGAALFFGAPVGWRRWLAIGVGFCGVLMVIRPGLDAFEPASLFGVLAVIGLSSRDLATRAIPARVASLQLSIYGFASIVPVGIVMLLVGDGPSPMTTDLTLKMLGALVLGVAGYYAITEAMRVGDVAVVTPFRYTRLIFALILGLVLFNERPDFWTLAGAAVIIASGLYTIWRERRLAIAQSGQ